MKDQVSVYTAAGIGSVFTHADYRALEEAHDSMAQEAHGWMAKAGALEEDRDSWRRVAEDLELRNGALNRELAALRGEVGELVEADREFDAAQMAFVMPKADITCDEAADNCEKAIERRRLALEALK